MTTQPIDAMITPDIHALGEQRWSAIQLEVAHETVESVIEAVAEMVETVISPGMQMKPRDMFEWFLGNLLTAYTTPTGFDRMGAIRELSWLLDPTYYGLMRSQVLPPPLSLPWAGCLENGVLFKALQRKFIKLHNAQTKALGLVMPGGQM